ncbi:8-oxo-dGTP diphosphatase [Dyadobacter jejuensis]|uniref:8-oxo-dGTP diphosphatase n=1 Tax=Dyadobacter jejuensis TaxID=1082580 RepID=A0A316AFN1_9BACT|nr:(deoxy)nucleoside triphosphate pyrophosphohydrolase [Dyadobacter jejuensis]PWJ56595.1 8-oxo-dGTP diphosphatase [Dyadobacter jejuensis]
MDTYCPIKLVVRVPCAIIEHEGLVLAAQRSAHLSFPLKWEFPGGKQEKNETDEQTLYREIREELDVDIEIIRPLPETVKDQGWREIVLVPFICRLKSFEMTLSEHEKILWLGPEALTELDWTEGDWDIIRHYNEYLSVKR